jgi:hypothetical protein
VGGMRPKCPRLWTNEGEYVNENVPRKLRWFTVMVHGRSSIGKACSRHKSQKVSSEMYQM